MNQNDSSGARSKVDNPVQQRRRWRVINPSFQWKAAGSLVVTVLFFSFLLSCGVFASLHQQARMRVINPSAASVSVAPVVMGLSLGFAAIVGGAVAFWSLFFTHRICGPLHVLQGYFAELARGKLPMVRPIRKKDECKELLRLFGHSIEALRAVRQNELTTVRRSLQTAQEASRNQEAREVLRRLVDDMSGLAARMEEGLRPQASLSPSGGMPNQPDCTFLSLGNAVESSGGNEAQPYKASIASPKPLNRVQNPNARH